jgi:hypothetical protein
MAWLTAALPGAHLLALLYRESAVPDVAVHSVVSVACVSTHAIIWLLCVTALLCFGWFLSLCSVRRRNSVQQQRGGAGQHHDHAPADAPLHSSSRGAGAVNTARVTVRVSHSSSEPVAVVSTQALFLQQIAPPGWDFVRMFFMLGVICRTLILYLLSA